MGTEFWIRIGMVLFARWLKRHREEITTQNIFINNLIAAKSINDLIATVTDDSAQEAIEEVISEVEDVTVATLLKGVFSK